MTGKKNEVKRVCSNTDNSYSVTDGDFTDCTVSIATLEQLDSVSMATAELDNLHHEVSFFMSQTCRL